MVDLEPTVMECLDRNPCVGLGRHAHFENFGMAFLTLFRIATGDNWNGIMKDALRTTCNPAENCHSNCCVSPIIAPIYFVLFVLMAQFVLVNVVVAVLMKHLQDSHQTMLDDEDGDNECAQNNNGDEDFDDFQEPIDLNLSTNLNHSYQYTDQEHHDDNNVSANTDSTCSYIEQRCVSYPDIISSTQYNTSLQSVMSPMRKKAQSFLTILCDKNNQSSCVCSMQCNKDSYEDSDLGLSDCAYSDISVCTDFVSDYRKSKISVCTSSVGNIVNDTCVITAH